MIKNKKIVKPIEIDAHFKYRCPKCGIDHWISLNEAQTRRFKIVCECKTVFSPKVISKVKIIYDTVGTKKTKSESVIQESKDSKSINTDLLVKCAPILMGYGFTKQESEDMLCRAYQFDQSNDCGQLVKLALKSLGVDKNE